MESRKKIIRRINQAVPASSHPPAAAAAIVTDEQTHSSSRRVESTLFVAGTKNPCTFFSILPNDATSIIGAMLLTPAPKDQHGFSPASLLKFMTEISKDNSNAGKEIFSHLKYSLKEMLYQAIIDDAPETVKTILDACPQLLLTRHKQNIIIESQYTWQKFQINANETPISVAAKRRQIEMLTLLSGYYDQLVQDKELDETSRQAAHAEKIAGLNAWPNEIAIPARYINDINQLIDVFCNESFPHDTADLTTLSAETEEAIHLLLELLIPNIAVELDKHIDVELFLLAAYQLYRQRFDAFTNWEQRNVFCIRVIGLIQSTLSPETAKIFCEGLLSVVMNGTGIGTLAQQLKSKDEVSFYRTSRESLSGLGRNHVIIAGHTEHTGILDMDIPSLNLERFLSNKNSKLTKLIQQSASSPDQSRSWCVIL